MTAITVAVKVGIVLVELHMSPAETLVSAIGCALDDALPGPVMRQQVFSVRHSGVEYSGWVWSL